MFRIARAHYHVAHIIPTMMAHEMAYFLNEGLNDYQVITDWSLVPATVEDLALGEAMKHHGVSVVVDAKPSTVFMHNTAGWDLRIIGGWRNQMNGKLVARKGISSISDLRGKRIAVRDRGAVTEYTISVWLRSEGIEPSKEVTWVTGQYVQAKGEGSTLDSLRKGLADAAFVDPVLAQPLLAEGFSELRDLQKFYPEGKPERVVATTSKMIEEHGSEVRSFLRGLIRAYWLGRDDRNIEYFKAVDRRLRNAAYDETEKVANLTNLSEIPDLLATNPYPIDGKPTMGGLRVYAEEQKMMGRLPESFDFHGSIEFSPVEDAFKELEGRGELQEQLSRVREVRRIMGY